MVYIGTILFHLDSLWVNNIQVDSIQNDENWKQYIESVRVYIAFEFWNAAIWTTISNSSVNIHI